MGSRERSEDGSIQVNRQDSWKDGEEYTPKYGDKGKDRDGNTVRFDGDSWVSSTDFKTTDYSDRNIALQEEGLAAQIHLSEEQVALAQSQEKRASEQYEIYKGLYLPGEIGFVRSSFAGIPIEQELAWASSGVNQSFDSALRSAERELQGFGVDPSSPKFAQMTTDFALARAAADAGARNAARKDVRDTNYERKRQAVLIGRDIPATASGISSQAASAYSGASAALAQGYGGAGSALANAAGLNYNRSRDQLNAELARDATDASLQAAQWSALGNLVGQGTTAAIGAWG